MQEKNIPVLIVVTLIFGVTLGAGTGYLFYGSKINSLASQITDFNSRLDTGLAELKNSSIELENEIDSIKSLSNSVGAINSRLGTIESETRTNKIQIESKIDSINKKLDTLSPLIQNENTIIDVYDRVSPAVVFITSTILSYDFRLRRNVPAEGVGSGVVVSPDGYILTNNHVVEDAEQVTVSFKPGFEIEAEIIGTDPATDLAVIKINPPPGLPVAVLGDSDRIRVGMTAIAIGNPFSLERTITAGVVSSVNRTLDAETGDIIFGIIQTDASVNPGNSGGPLVNSKGEVIGINSAIISPVQGSVGIGFAIPINTAKKVMTQLIEKGMVSRPYLGITGGSVSDFPEELNLPEKGVLIIDVLEFSPAGKAGLKGFDSEVVVNMVTYPVGGDVITSMDNVPINTIEDLLEYLSKKDVGDTVSIGYVRNGIEGKTSVILEERPVQ